MENLIKVASFCSQNELYELNRGGVTVKSNEDREKKCNLRRKISIAASNRLPRYRELQKLRIITKSTNFPRYFFEG